MRNRRAWIACIALVAASAAADEVYRYTDEQGQVHFTDSYYEVPAQYRRQIEHQAREPGDPGPGRLSVVPGFGSRPDQAGSEKGQKGKGKAGAKDAGFAAEFQANFSKRFTKMTGHPPSSMSPGLALFAILVGLLTALAIGGGFLKTGCNIVGERPLVLGHAMLIVLIQGIAGGLASGALHLTLQVAGQPGPALAGIGLAAGLVTSTAVNAAVLKGMHCDTWWGAFKVTFAVMLLCLILSAPLLYCAMR